MWQAPEQKRWVTIRLFAAALGVSFIVTSLEAQTAQTEGDRLEERRVAAERAEAARRQAERAAAEKADAERRAAERAKAEAAAEARAAAERAEAERRAAAQAAEQRAAAERAEAMRRSMAQEAAARAEAQRKADERERFVRHAQEASAQAVYYAQIGRQAFEDGAETARNAKLWIEQQCGEIDEYSECKKIPLLDGGVYIGSSDGTRPSSSGANGMYISPDGSTYYGGWVYYGGQYTRRNGNVYAGGWDRGKRSGDGGEQWADGSRFEGHYKNDQINMYGVYYYASGDRYEGYWVNGQRSDFGIYRSNNGRAYARHYTADHLDQEIELSSGEAE